MPLLTQPSKIERIRQSALTVISEKGLANSSVQNIALHAGVSTGYLYRHYSGKEALINDLLDQTFEKVSDELEKVLNEKKCAQQIIERVVGFVFDSTVENPEKIKFLIMLQNDFSVRFNHNIIERLNRLCNRTLKACIRSGGVRSNLTVEELYVALISIPLQYATMVFRNVFADAQFNQKLKEKMIRQSLASLQ